jgi:hypothetical protein
MSLSFCFRGHTPTKSQMAAMVQYFVIVAGKFDRITPCHQAIGMKGKISPFPAPSYALEAAVTRTGDFP